MIIASYVRKDQVAGTTIAIRVKSGVDTVTAKRSIHTNIESTDVGNTTERLNIKIWVDWGMMI